MRAKRRNVRSGHEYDFYFERASNENTLISPRTTAHDTVLRMAEIANRYRYQTEAISRVLDKNDIYETAKNIWNFVYDHINYRADNPEIEQLRTPARTWEDRFNGVDCDCYSIFISSILLNLDIPHSFRVTDYGNGWQHVYVVAFLPSGKEIIIDPVMNSFDAQKPYKRKFDYKMKLEMLSGFNGLNSLPELEPYRNPNYPAVVGSYSTGYPNSNAYQKMLNNVQDMNYLQGTNYSLGKTDTPEKEGTFTKIKNWISDNPVATGGIMVGATLIGIGAYRYFKKGKGKKRSGRLRGLDDVDYDYLDEFDGLDSIDDYDDFDGLEGRRRRKKSKKYLYF